MSGQKQPHHTHCPNFLDMLTLEPGRRKTAEDRPSEGKLSTNTKYQYNTNTNTEVQVPTTNGGFCEGLDRNIGGQISANTAMIHLLKDHVNN